MREGSPTHGSRRGLSSTAPIGAVEPFSEYGIYATNLRYMTLMYMRKRRVSEKRDSELRPVLRKEL